MKKTTKNGLIFWFLIWKIFEKINQIFLKESKIKKMKNRNQKKKIINF